MFSQGLSTVRQLGAIALVAGLMSVSGTAPASAVDDVVVGTNHFFECLQYILRGDTAAHKANCASNRVPEIAAGQDDHDDKSARRSSVITTPVTVAPTVLDVPAVIVAL